MNRVFVCANCNRLDSSERRHTITCSTACRVALHRHPERLASLKATCAEHKVSVARVLQSRAVLMLRPDLGHRIQSGELETDDTQPDVYRAFMALVMEQARNASDETLREVAP